jgi:N-methylhydantoinase A
LRWPGEPIEFVALRVAGIAELGRPATANGRGGGSSKPAPRAQARLGGQNADLALYERAFAPDRFAGPAIVMEETATTLIPAGWAAGRVAGGQLLLERIQ